MLGRVPICMQVLGLGHFAGPVPAKQTWWALQVEWIEERSWPASNRSIKGAE